MPHLLFVIALIVLSVGWWSPKLAYAGCYGSQGGNGDVWLQVKALAGGQARQGMQVSLQAKTWLSGYGYAWESACTDSNGIASFRKQQNPASECYSTYSSSSGGTVTYCNWRSAHCYKQCYADNLSGYYSSTTFSSTGYKVVVSPPNDSSVAERYGNCEVSDIATDFDGSRSVECSLAEKNILMRIRAVDDDGNAITSGFTAYVSGPSYFSKVVVASFTDVYVEPGTYYVGMWCTDYRSCGYGCISNATIRVSDNSSQIVEVTLTAKRNNASFIGTVKGSDGPAIAGAYCSLGNYNYSAGSNACYAYGYGQTDSNGNCSITIPSGNYTLWVSPPYDYSNNGSNYSSVEKSVTLVANQTVTKDITLLKKDATISGIVKDSNGVPLQNAWVSTWTYSEQDRDWGSGKTGSDGRFSVPVLSGRKYSVYASYWDSSSYGNEQTVANTSREGTQSVLAPASEISFTFDVWDHTVNFALVDAAGNALSNVQGGASIRPKDSKAEYWYGAWVTFTSASTRKKLAASKEYIVEPYVWGSADFDPQATRISFTTGGSGESSTVTIPFIAADATLSGRFIDDSNNQIDLDVDYISVNAVRGGTLWRIATASTRDYTCKVSAGRQCISYWVDWNSTYASLSPGASTNCIDVVAGSSNTLDLKFLKVAYIRATAKDNHGDPRKWVWVEASPYSASQQVSDERRRYWENGCSTDVEGKCTIRIGAESAGTKYYLTAHESWIDIDDENLTLPDEVEVTVAADQTVDAPELIFRVLDAESSITVTSASDALVDVSKGLPLPNPIINSDLSLDEQIVSGAWISAFSDQGGYSEATADTAGHATLKCTGSDLWHAFGVNLIAKKLYASEASDVACLSGTLAEVNVKLNYVTDVPDSISQTWDAGIANTLALSDNASIKFDALSLGDSGENVTCTMEPDPYIQRQAGSGRPACFYGYDITCNDASGNAITQLNGNATVCLPLCDQMAKVDLTSEDTRLVHFDTSTDAFISQTETTVDQQNNLQCAKTNHLTKFVLVGNGNLKGVDGDQEDAVEEAERTGEPISGEVSGPGGCGCQMSTTPTVADVIVMLLTGLGILVVRCRVKMHVHRVRSKDPRC